ncbi:hypothetical protein EW145_g3445 [Phellinidium pouzarii]|uniref:Uncharacterized protein n=1 Tax=Phellinidium pouzarii TaxID=167371 RepID=A0A4S4L7C4_9AGAM|nr:hypothetical protein EW145_g3445 [Phellinidium pouzarii]
MGFPGARGYTNAWDSVPSIQKYASRLAKPPLGSAPPPTPRSPHVRKQSDSYRSRGEQSDANSMDGDVEDEGDDDSGIEADSRPSSNERPDRGKARADLPRSGPMSPPSGPSRPKKGYRSYGVQTVPKDVRSVSVQVSQSTSTPTGKSRRNSRHSSASSSPVIMPHIDLPRQPPIQEMVLGAEQTALATPSLGNVHPHTRSSGGRHHHQHGSGVLSPRLHDVYTFESPNRTPPTGSPGTQSPVTRKAPAAVQPTRPLMLDTQQMQAPPFGIVRSSSTETADSPLGPVSPADSLPGPPPRKPVGRTWNPATGVDVFKRGSEEVLARFLRMGSWEEESQSASPSHRF